MKRKPTIRIIFFISAVVFLCLLESVTVCASSAQERKPEVSTFDELSGKTISMLTGAPFEELISSKVPDVKEFTYYSTSSDMALALTSGKTDAFLQNTAVGELFVNQDEARTLLEQAISEKTGKKVPVRIFEEGLNEKDTAQLRSVKVEQMARERIHMEIETE